MKQLSKFVTVFLIFLLPTAGNTVDYDTLYLRGQTYMILPRYDTLKELKEVNRKADTLLLELKQIAEILKTKDTVK